MALIIYTEKEIATRFNVTQEQIDRASRVIDCQTGKVFYQVSSQTTDGKVYEVRYNSRYKRLTCNCPAGQAGVPCWHKRATSAAAFEYRQAENIQARKEAEEAANHKAYQEAARAKTAAQFAKLEAQREAARKVEGFSFLA